MSIEKIIYRAHATATGGRDGRARSSDGKLDVKLAVPKEMGGGGGEATNPEQMFAAGYAACFLGAMKYVAGQKKMQVPADTSIDSSVGIGPTHGGFGSEVDMNVKLPGRARAHAQR